MAYNTTEQNPAELQLIVAQYEKLRLAALGEPLLPEARSGLALFLRQGMWAWTRSLAVDKDQEHATSLPSSTSIASRQNKTVIQIFAAMTLNINYGRAHNE